MLPLINLFLERSIAVTAPVFMALVTERPSFRQLYLCCVVWILLPWVAGCDRSQPTFQPNQLFAKRLELTQGADTSQVQDDVSEVLVDLFGTPDVPKWPESLESYAPELVSLERLTRAAGAVSSDQSGEHVGLFREHCVICHGFAGDGQGPAAALQNPYPRDFRLGKFKFKSTPIGRKPSRADLRETLRRGIPGTAMPSFALLEDADLEALVDYIIYLSIRGQSERQLLAMAVEEDDGSDVRIFDSSHWPEVAEEDSPQQVVQEVCEDVLRPWAEAENYLFEVELPERPPLVNDAHGAAATEELTESIARGQELFRGNIAACAFCHGTEARGDGQQNNYDDWTREWTALAGLNPADREQLRPMLELGALKPRVILPRNLQTGVFRGGGRPEDLYRRIVLGIEGTPMPAAPMQPANRQGLSEDDVWDIVNYLLSLSADRSPTSVALVSAGADDE